MLQIDSNAISYDYIAVCWSSIRHEYKEVIFAVSTVAKISKFTNFRGAP